MVMKNRLDAHKALNSLRNVRINGNNVKVFVPGCIDSRSITLREVMFGSYVYARIHMFLDPLLFPIPSRIMFDMLDVTCTRRVKT